MILLDLQVRSKKWSVEKNVEKFVENSCEKIFALTDLKKLLQKKVELGASISLVCDAQMKKINLQFRGKNKPTNVLSFASLDEKLLRKKGIEFFAKPRCNLFLGDIVISFETVKKEAVAQNKTFKNHLTHLLVHGILHLIGYDHEEEKMAQEMENLEVKILAKLGVKNPY